MARNKYLGEQDITPPPVQPELAVQDGLDTAILLKPAPGSSKPIEVSLGSAFSLELATLDTYYTKVNKNQRVIDHPRRVAGLLNDFASGFLGPEVYCAALLHDVGQTAAQNQTQNIFATNAKRTLLLYYGTKEQSQKPIFMLKPMEGESVKGGWEYIHTLLSDLETVENFSEESRFDDEGKTDEVVRILHGGEGRISPDTWLEPASIRRTTRMLELLGDVQVESVLIKAAEMIDNLQNPPKDDRAIFRDIHDAESLYIPLLEIMGMDGMASALRNETYTVRIRKSGHGAFLDKANELLADLAGRDDALSSIHSLIAALNVGDFDIDHAIQDAMQHGVKYGTIEAQLPGQADTIRAIWRIKSPGSLAMKLMDYANNLVGTPDDVQRSGLAQLETLPADIVGVTFVTENIFQLATLFTRMANAVYDDSDISMTFGNKRTSSVHIRGTIEFRLPMTGALLIGETGGNDSSEYKPRYVRDDIDEKKEDGKPDAYDVAKFTCADAKGMRTEVQFLTETARIASRIGIQAHVLYKLKEQLRLQKQNKLGEPVTEKPHVEVTEDDLQALESINLRMKELRKGGSGLSAASIMRAKAVWRTIARVTIPGWSISQS